MKNRSAFEIEDVEIRAEEDGKKTISGYAVKWEKLSVKIGGYFREKVLRGAFTKSLKENNIRALWNHNHDIVLGSTKGGSLRLWEDETGLRFELDVADTQAGRDALVTIERKDVDGMSFGFNIRGQEWDETDEKNIIRTLTDVDLREISPTPFPAYPQSKVSVRTIEDDFKDFLEEKQKENIDAQKKENEGAVKKTYIKTIF